MRIVFMGTPDFAVPSLEALIQGGYEIAAAVTQPDSKSGRGYAPSEPPVKRIAAKYSIPVLQFKKIKSPEGVEALKKAAPDIIVTAAFGQILSKEILDIPPLGCINVHASLLPKYRGASPVQWAIIKGEKKTGVTIMYMDERLDAGDVISYAETDIGETETGGELYGRLARIGAGLLAETLKKIEKGSAARIKQDESEASYYPPLTKEAGRIDWSKPAKEIYDLIRALDPAPGAYSYAGDGVIKIWSAQTLDGSAPPGEIVEADTALVIGTGEGLISVKLLQVPGSRKMTPREFFRGRKLPGERFG